VKRFDQLKTWKDANKAMEGCKVVLCTLSMLSNSRLYLITNCVPLACLVVDEASQISLGGYMSILDKQSENLRKMVFIGDDKQCEYYYSYRIIYLIPIKCLLLVMN
jgi:hypothetical protein